VKEGAQVAIKDGLEYDAPKGTACFGVGQKLFEFVGELRMIDERTFRLIRQEPCGFVLEALGKPNANVSFIVPARIAATTADQA
jgi:hypothetical protein